MKKLLWIVVLCLLWGGTANSKIIEYSNCVGDAKGMRGVEVITGKQNTDQINLF